MAQSILTYSTGTHKVTQYQQHSLDSRVTIRTLMLASVQVKYFLIHKISYKVSMQLTLKIA